MLNRLIELSVIPHKEGDLFAAVPVKSFRTNGNEIKSLTMVATPAGEMILYDVGGNSIANATLNSTLGSENFKAGNLPDYEPLELIKPPNVNELIFGVRSKKRIDAFRLITDDSKA